MVTKAEELQIKNMNTPDEIRMLPGTEVHIVNLGDTIISKAIFQPGWRWSINVKPKAVTEYCQVLHIGYMLSGRMCVQMEDGKEMVMSAGEAFIIPPGHDAWVVGSEPVVFLDFSGGKTYAK